MKLYSAGFLVALQMFVLCEGSCQPVGGYDGPNVLLRNYNGRFTYPSTTAPYKVFGNLGITNTYAARKAALSAQLDVWDQNGGKLMHEDKISLRVRSGRYVSDNNGSLQMSADRSTVQLWETWRVIKSAGGGEVRNNDIVYLKREGSSRFATTLFTASYPLWANSTSVGNAQKLTWIDVDDRPDFYIPGQGNVATKGNCVAYARSRLGDALVPSGMSSAADKWGKCNVRNGASYYSAVWLTHAQIKIGRFVLIYVPPGSLFHHTGHVAVVEQKNPNGTLTIREANWGGAVISSRSGTPSQLGIVGTRY